MAKKLIIAIDCDYVLVPSTEHIVRMYNEKCGTNVQLDGAHSSSNPDWQASREEIAERIYDIQLSDEYVDIAPWADAVDVCRELSGEHELHLVTARPGRIMAVTIGMLEKYFPGVFSEIEHVGLDGNKGDICHRLGADVLIDDNLKHLHTAKECGVKNLIWFGDYPWQNRDSTTVEEGVVICSTWSDVEREIERIATE